MLCPYCKFKVPDEDWDLLLEHIEERHPEIYRKKYVKHPDDIRAEIADEEYEETPVSE